MLEKATQEEQILGKPNNKTLLTIAELLVTFAPNYYTSPGSPSYSDEEKHAAKTLLTKFGLEQLINLSPRYKKKTLDAIWALLDGEA